MSDRTEDEDERYVRRVARRMAVDPDHLARCLKPHGFTLIYANRHEGINRIELLRPSITLSGLFDEVAVSSNIHGEPPGVDAGVSISPGGGYAKTALSEFIPATDYGYARAQAGPRYANEGRRFSTQLAEAIPRVFGRLYETQARTFHEQTASARAAAERYLKHVRASTDLDETLQRLRNQATETQKELTRQYLERETLTPFYGRIIWEITLLCHVLLWERSSESCLGKVNYRHENSDEIEAHRRIQIVLSRLARRPGWPLHDPLVPNRPLDEESTPWRDGKPSLVAELFDEHLAAEGKHCECGRHFAYLSHVINSNHHPPTARVTIRCNAGHEETIDMAWKLPGSGDAR